MDDINFHLKIESRDITLCHWCRHSSVESSLPSILLPRVRLPSTPSFINYSQICLSFRCEKRTKINKKGAGLRPFLKYIAIAAFWCEELPFSTHQSRGKRFQKMKKILRCRWGECLPQPIRCFLVESEPIPPFGIASASSTSSPFRKMSAHRHRRRRRQPVFSPSQFRAATTSFAILSDIKSFAVYVKH